MISLTMQQIKDLAEFAGFRVGDEWSQQELDDTELTIADCPPGGVLNDGEPGEPESHSHYHCVAYFTDYPEEGCIGLGPELDAPVAAPPAPPAPPPMRVEYRGLLSSFIGPEDEFERWRATPRQRLLRHIEPAVTVLFLLLLISPLLVTAALKLGIFR